jgi:hypothetical protein
MEQKTDPISPSSPSAPLSRPVKKNLFQTDPLPRAGAAASAVFLSARSLILRLILRFRCRP